MSTPRDESAQQARDMSAARAASRLDVLSLGQYIHGTYHFDGTLQYTYVNHEPGNSDTLESRTRVSQALACDPLFAGPAPVSRPDVYARSMAQMDRLYSFQVRILWL